MGVHRWRLLQLAAGATPQRVSVLLKYFLTAPVSLVIAFVLEVPMGKKRILIFSCVAVVLVGAFTAARNTTTKAVRSNLPAQAHASLQSPVASDQVVYDFLFHKVVRLREKTRELQAQGRIGLKPYFPLQSEAGLTEGETTALEAIAFACREQVRQQDEKAKAIIIAFQSRFPGGRVPEGGAPHHRPN